MTAPKPDDSTDPATLGRLAGSVGALSQQVADIRRRLETVTRTLDQAEIDQLAARLADLDTRFGQFAGTINDALDAAAPKGPPAPRWDNLDPAAYTAQLDALRTWVDTILIPIYVTGGGYTLADCWAEHPQAVWELGTIAVAWRRAYLRRRPDLAQALDWHDRWLPGAMRRLEDATRRCAIRHQPGDPRRAR
jgi:hypothetical protein